MGYCQDSLSFELFVQLPMSSAIQCEWSTIHESAQIVVFIKIGYPVLHFVSIKVGLNVSDLYISLKNKNRLSAIEH